MELLVVSRDRPVPESPGKWREGDVVVVKEDGHEWGREELNPDKFTILRVPGVSAAQGEKYLEMKGEPSLLTGEVEMLARRRFRLGLSRFPNPQGRTFRVTDLLQAEREV